MLINLENIPMGTKIEIEGVLVNVSKTMDQHQCCRCVFLEKSDKCPKGEKYPACFASERQDKESVYFPPVERKIKKTKVENYNCL